MAGDYDQASLTMHFEATNRRMDYIEDQMVRIAETAHTTYAKYADTLQIPDEVVALARAGKKLDAVKKYRELTGAGSEQAREAIISP